MSFTIRADIDQLRAVAKQLRGGAERIESQTATLQGAMDALAAVWEGAARERGLARWAEIWPNYQPHATELEHFAAEMDALANRLEEAARIFGGGANMGGIQTLWGQISDIANNPAMQSLLALGLLPMNPALLPLMALPSLAPFMATLRGPETALSTPSATLPTSGPPPRVYIINGIRSTAAPGQPDSYAQGLERGLEAQGLPTDQVVTLPAVYNTNLAQYVDPIQGTSLGGWLSPLDQITGMAASGINATTGFAANAANTGLGAAQVAGEYMNGANGGYTQQEFSAIEADLRAHPLLPGQRIVLAAHSGGGAVAANLTPMIESRLGGDVAAVVTMGSPMVNDSMIGDRAKIVHIHDSADMVGLPLGRSGITQNTLPVALPLLGALGPSTVAAMVLGTDQILRPHNPGIVEETTFSGTQNPFDAHSSYWTSSTVLDLIGKDVPEIGQVVNR